MNELSESDVHVHVQMVVIVVGHCLRTVSEKTYFFWLLNLHLNCSDFDLVIKNLVRQLAKTIFTYKFI